MIIRALKKIVEKALLRSPEEKFFRSDVGAGKLVENFVFGEIQKQITWSVTQPNMYHFRTAEGKEVDIVLEDRSGRVVGIEVKSSLTVTPHDAQGLQFLKQKCGKSFVQGLLLYMGSDTVPLGEKIIAAPISSLWK